MGCRRVPATTDPSVQGTTAFGVGEAISNPASSVLFIARPARTLYCRSALLRPLNESTGMILRLAISRCTLLPRSFAHMMPSFLHDPSLVRCSDWRYVAFKACPQSPRTVHRMDGNIAAVEDSVGVRVCDQPCEDNRCGRAGEVLGGGDGVYERSAVYFGAGDIWTHAHQT